MPPIEWMVKIMSEIRIKIMSEDALSYLKTNIAYITRKIQQNEENTWIYDEFPQPLFIEKKYMINDFELEENEAGDKQIDFDNSVRLYEALKCLPRYILTSEGFWLWLYFEKFYKVSKQMMEVKGVSTILDHWTFKQGIRRGLMFGVLSRCFFRVELTVDEKLENKYELTKWIIYNPERYRNLTWRNFSSEEHLVRGIVKGEKRALESIEENNSMYREIAKYISEVGSVKLLDVVSEEEIENLTYNKMIELSEAM